MNVRHILTVLIFLVALPFVSAASYYIKILNPNDYAVTDYQLRIDLNTNIPSLVNQPISQITNLNTGQILNFCYETDVGECGSSVTSTGYIWVKIDSIPAKDYIVIRIDSDGSTNGATTGDNVFDFYDDFNDETIDNNKWQISLNCPSGQISFESGMLKISAGNNQKQWCENGVISSSGFGNGIFEVRYGKYTRDHISFSLMFKIYIPNNELQLEWTEPDLYKVVKVRNGNYYLEKQLTLDGTSLHIIKTDLLDDGIIIYYDGSEIYSLVHGALQSSDQNHIKLCSAAWGSSSSGYGYFDWVRVRKYIDQELILQSAYSQAQLSSQTATSQSTTFEQTYNYVKIKYVAGINSAVITNVAIPLVIDTQTWISEGKLQSDCSDMYITYYDPVDGTEKPAPYFIDKQTCNTPQTIVYVKLPQIASDRDITLFIYHGVSGTAVPYEDPKNTFYFFVDLSSQVDVNRNLDIFTSGTASYKITDNGIHVTTGSDGYVAIYNK